MPFTPGAQEPRPPCINSEWALVNLNSAPRFQFGAESFDLPTLPASPLDHRWAACTATRVIAPIRICNVLLALTCPGAGTLPTCGPAFGGVTRSSMRDLQVIPESVFL